MTRTLNVELTDDDSRPDAAPRDTYASEAMAVVAPSNPVTR